MSRRGASDQQRERAALLASIAAKRIAKLASKPKECQASEDTQIGTAWDADSQCLNPSEEQRAAKPPAQQPALRRIGKRAAVEAVADCMAGLSISTAAAKEVDSPAAPSPEAIERLDSEAIAVSDTEHDEVENEQTATSAMPQELQERAVGLELGENKQFKLQKVVSQILYDHQVSLKISNPVCGDMS